MAITDLPPSYFSRCRRHYNFIVLTCYKNNNTNLRQKFLTETNPVITAPDSSYYRPHHTDTSDTFLGCSNRVIYKVIEDSVWLKQTSYYGRLWLLRTNHTDTFYRCRRHYKFIVLTFYKKNTERPLSTFRHNKDVFHSCPIIIVVFFVGYVCDCYVIQ